MHPGLIEIEQHERESWLPLLLLADEDEAVVRSYLHDGDMHAVYLEGDQLGVVQCTFPEPHLVELKNMAVTPERQGQGVGKQIIAAACRIYQSKGYHRMIVGTANSSIANLIFYQKAGFRFSHVRPDFFADYAEAIYENGIRALDMVMFSKTL
ncbi:N-acetyltransferase [Thalassobacillus sp. CUG 92003]|uniref:GNAT family N-acetyltransferase n=1 Tax=Thalassobacillus sp. CUG 92003 TaxID=2736641 RepID=UPI0015E6DFB7|nr:GNAT family N-acetyltransferase [Thalassobacillus sp. CUG 92003]